MKRTILALALGTGALAVSAAPAAAQTARPANVSVRLGVFFPFDEDVRDAIGETWIGAGIEYRFRELAGGGVSPTDRGSLSISLDYLGKEDFSHVPILLNYIGRREQFYYTAGVGIGFLQAFNDDETRLAFSLGIGYDFNTGGGNPLFVEARYWGSAESEANGIAVYAGIRF